MQKAARLQGPATDLIDRFNHGKFAQPQEKVVASIHAMAATCLGAEVTE